MQFVFGDNTSKYTMLYFDDKPDAAEKAQSLVQMSYSPNPDYESVGFVPFGANNTRALFFKFCKDFKMKRNVYFLHGVYGDVDPEYFYGKDYVNGLFTQFLDQEKFDVLRDSVLAGESCNVPYGYDKTLAATPCDQVKIEGADLHEILTKLYQRKNVVLVMDDDKFSNDRALLLIKKIFFYLPPSLRKLCSYVTAVDDTGSMNFMLRIIPRCMLKLKEEHVDLDNQSNLYKDKTNFSAIAAALMAMSDVEREEVFRLYEMLYYGRDSIYKKQNFERFYECYTSSSADAEGVKLCDELLTDYLENPKRVDNPEIPGFLRNALANSYASEAVLDARVDWNPANLENLDKFCDINGDVMRKVYYLVDRELSYFRRKLETAFCRSYVSAEMAQLKMFYQASLNSAKAMTDVQSYERPFMVIMADILKYLDNVVKAYIAVKNQAKAYADEYLGMYCKNGANDPRAVLDYVMGKVWEQVAQLQPMVTDIQKDLESFVLHDVVSAYNTKCNEMARQKRDQRDRDMKNNIFAAFVYRLKKDTNPEEVEMPVDVSPEDLTVDDLYLVAEDEELRPKLAQEVTAYIMGVCALRNEGDFTYNGNDNLKLIKHMKLGFEIAKNLCQQNAVDYAVLYLLAYFPRSDSAIKYILQMSELDELDGRGLSNLKNFAPALLKRRRKIDKLDSSELRDLDRKAKEVLDDKSVTKPRRVVAVMVHDMVVGGPTILERERKRNLILAVCAGVGALLLIGALVLAIVLGGDKNGSGDDTKNPQTTTAPSSPTDPTDPPACETHSYNDVTVAPNCTQNGTKTFTCTVCGHSYTEELAALGHVYENGACTVCQEVCPGHEYRGGVCTVCGLTCEEHSYPEPQEGVKTVCSVCGLCETHADEDWAEATCTDPKTCEVCGLTEGEALGHSWVDATCETAKTCSVCEAVEGEALGHYWTQATCKAPQTCNVCEATEGEIGDHRFAAATCTAPKTCEFCEITEGKALGHSMVDATCETAETCKTCGLTEGDPLGHDWGEPETFVGTCTQGAGREYICNTCGGVKVETDEPVGHSYENGACKVCGAAEPAEPENPEVSEDAADPAEPDDSNAE